MNAFAAFCSFCCPGLGQLLQGRIGLAVFFFVGSVLLFLIAVATLVGFVLFIPFWLWGIVNAARYQPNQLGAIQNIIQVNNR